MSDQSGRQKRNRSPPGKEKQKPVPRRKVATFSTWCQQPLWLLDSWTYTVRVDGKTELPRTQGRSSDTLWVERTSENETSMLLLREGAAMAALCASQEGQGGGEETTGRDVALTVHMAKMIAFLPFRGVRANSKEGPLLVCDRRQVDYDITPSVVVQHPPLFKTPMLISLRFLEEVLVALPRACLLMTKTRSAIEWVGISCGILGDVLAFHTIASLVQIRDFKHMLLGYLFGAIMADNSTSIDLLLRFPLEDSEKLAITANIFHMSTAASPHFITRPDGPTTLLNFITLWMEHCQPDYYGVFAFHTNLLSSIISQKKYPCFGDGHIHFPRQDFSDFLVDCGHRLRVDGSVVINGRRFTLVDLRVLAIEHSRENYDAWYALPSEMRRHQVIHVKNEEVHSNAANTTRSSSSFTQEDVIIRALEIGTKQHQDCPFTGVHRLWSLLGLKSTSETVCVLGDTYTPIQCVLKGLAMTSAFTFSECQFRAWGTAGRTLLPYTAPGRNLAETHCQDPHGNASDDANYFNNIECLLVELGGDPEEYGEWAHLGFVLRKNILAAVSSTTTATNESPVEEVVNLPSVIVKGRAKLAFDQALKTQRKKVSDVKKALSSDKAEKVKGAGGREKSFGPCKYVYQLTELDCYLIDLHLNEEAVLKRIGIHDPPEVLKRMVEVVTLDRLGEQGKRIVEKYSSV